MAIDRGKVTVEPVGRPSRVLVKIPKEAPPGTPKYGRDHYKPILTKEQWERKRKINQDLRKADRVISLKDHRDLPRLSSGLQPPKALPLPRSAAAGIAKACPRALERPAGGARQASALPGAPDSGSLALAPADGSSREAAALLRAGATVGEPPERMAELALTVADGADRGALQAQDLSDSLWAAAASGAEAPDELRRALPALADSLLGRAEELDAASSCDALWSVAVLKNEAPMLHMLLPSLVERVVRTAPTMSARDAATAAWSVATLWPDLTETLELNMEPVVDLLVRRFLQRHAEADTAAVAHMLWAASFMSVGHEHLPKLARLLADGAERNCEDLRGETLQVVLWSAATLSGTAAGAEMKRLLPRLAEAASRETASMTPLQISSTVWALGALDYEPGEVQLFEGAREGLAVAADELPPYDLSLFMWGLGALEYYDEELMQICAARVTKIIKHGDAKSTAESLSRMVWAFARLGLENEELRVDLLNAIKDRVGIHKDSPGRIIRYLSHSSIVSIVWGLERLDTDGAFQQFRSDVAAKLRWSLDNDLEHEYVQTDAQVKFSSKDSTRDLHVRREKADRKDPEEGWFRKEYIKPLRTLIREKVALKKGHLGPDEPRPVKTLREMLEVDHPDADMGKKGKVKEKSENIFYMSEVGPGDRALPEGVTVPKPPRAKSAGWMAGSQHLDRERWKKGKNKAR